MYYIEKFWWDQVPGSSSGTETSKYFIFYLWNKDIILPQILKQYRCVYNKICKVVSDSHMLSFPLFLSPEITTSNLVQDIFLGVYSI